VTGCITCRYLSARKGERQAAAKFYESLGLSQPKPMGSVDKKELIESVRNALYASKICSYAQVASQLFVFVGLLRFQHPVCIRC
jgi:6-phosphogluconate dehydrogenase